MIKTPISIEGAITVPITLKGEINLSTIKEKPELENLEVTPSREQQIFKSEKYGFDEVIVKGIECDELNVTPTTEEQVFEGVYDKITVGVGTDSSDATATSNDIALGRTAYVMNRKVEGTAETVDTRDADATPEDIKLGKTAYVNNEKIIGTSEVGEENTVFITDGVVGTSVSGTSGNPYCLNRLIKKFPPKISIGYTGNLDHFFYYCINVTDFPELVQEIGNGSLPKDIINVPGMFQECTKLIKPPYFNTSKVGNASNMFTNDKNLEELPDYDFSLCTKFIEFLYLCGKIKNITNVTFGQPVYIEKIFYDCKSLEYIPEIDYSRVSSINYAFSGCNNLKTDLVIDLSNCRAVQYTFNGCGSKTNNKITLKNTSQVYDWRYSFMGSTGNIDPIPDMSGTTQIESMFSSNNLIETLPINSIGNATSIYCICFKCTSLKSFPQINTNKVTRFQRFVYGCTNLTDIPVLDMTNASQGTHIQDMYFECFSLSDDSLNNIMASLLTAVKITNATYKNLKYIGLSQEQAIKCATLSNWSELSAKGWTTGY